LDEQEIEALFNRVAKSASEKQEDVRNVFFTLIRTTLKYRDHLSDSNGITLTVEDVQTVLEWLVSALNTGRVPVTENKIRLDLLKLWIDELKII
jgi:hypothetical protein